MNRRRFLKYAGATAAVVGASALGLSYLPKPSQPIAQTTLSSTEAISTTSLSSVASVTETNSTTELGDLDLGANDLGGYVFHDYNGNGRLDQGEPFINDVEIVAQNYYATFRVKPQNGIYVFKNLPGRSYKVYPVHPQNNFRYMSRSNAELVETKQGYTIDFRGKQRQDMALMEGFLTIPMPNAVRYKVGAQYDLDAREVYYLYWNGEKGVRSENGRYGFNHHGIDFAMDEGEPIVAAAPGIVTEVVTGLVSIKTSLASKYYTIWYGHPRKSLVTIGQSVSRGQKIAENGALGQPQSTYFHLHFGISSSDLRRPDGSAGWVDPYVPTFDLDLKNSGYWITDNTKTVTSSGIDILSWISTRPDKNPNLVGYWTQKNSPHFATQNGSTSETS